MSAFDPLRTFAFPVQINLMKGRDTGQGLFSLPIIFRRMLPITLGLMLMLALIAGAWDFGMWGGVPPLHIAAFVGFLVAGGTVLATWMEWDQRKERKQWAVSLSQETVSIRDEKGGRTDVPLAELELVVVTSSQSMWRDDMDVSIFDQRGEAVVWFPLVAPGAEEFVRWLSGRNGFRADELADAKASRRSASGHLIWEAPE